MRDIPILKNVDSASLENMPIGAFSRCFHMGKLVLQLHRKMRS